MKRGISVRSIVGLVLIAGTSGLSQALGAEFKALLDLDNDSATGCVAVTADGSLPGVEQILTTQVDVATRMVAAVYRETCVNPATDAFGPPVPINVPFTPPWPIGSGLGIAGADVIETYVPYSVGPSNSAQIRMGFEVSEDGVCPDAMVTDNGQPGGSPMVLTTRGPVAVPTLSRWSLLLIVALLLVSARAFLRRRSTMLTTISTIGVCVLSAPLLWAQIVTLDGDPGDWMAASPLGIDVVDPAPDLVGSFARYDHGSGVVFVRFDSTLTSSVQAMRLCENLGTSPAGTPEDTGQDAYAFEVSTPGTTVTLTALPDAFLDIEIFLYAPGTGGPGATNLLTGNPFGLDAAGVAGSEGAVLTLGGAGTYTLAIEDGRSAISQVAGSYTVSGSSDLPIGAPFQTVDNGPESE